MTDDRNKTGRPDRNRINRYEDYEINYWSIEFGVPKQRVLEAIDQVGVMVNDVRRYLGK